MKKLLFLSLSLLIFIIFTSCESSTDKAEQTVRNFASMIKNGSGNIDSIYPDYSLWRIKDWIDKPTISDLSCADSISIIKSKLLSKNGNIDTCEVICKNVVKSKFKYTVKFVVIVTKTKTYIDTSYGLIQLNPMYKSILIKAGGIDENTEDRTIAALWKDLNDFIRYNQIIHGNNLSKVHFNKNDYSNFMEAKVKFENEQIFKGNPTFE